VYVIPCALDRRRPDNVHGEKMTYIFHAQRIFKEIIKEFSKKSRPKKRGACGKAGAKARFHTLD
jgi:hypothetical protein